MRYAISPYSPEALPSGFSYPQSYLVFIKRGDILCELAWEFPTEEFDHAAKEWERRCYWGAQGWLYLDKIDPIPFARNGDWAAFFDGNDHSGDPRIVIADLGNKQNSYKVANFDAWLSAAKKQSGIGDPPYDKVSADPLYPAAAEHSDGYYFCPDCYEPNRLRKEYDEAIRCVNCETLFNV